ncbi:MAG: 23S rRNA (uracil(1939)-C(5))-methyltransferase RlmD [Azoarcus sp.]|jgi:23S rRNA (uracil1939-C5)-methyltransferase|nr:23S rRNA (uracil(1939)-C(5))-methyltransferase RlmD [Azoarcus sp.]
MPIAVIESLDHEGRGIVRVDGKAVFVEGALPGETVEYEVLRARPTYEQARAVRILRKSGQRVAPRCPNFGVCGGCSSLHLDPLAQAAVKQRVMEDAFWHIAKLRPEIIYPAMTGQTWGYRQRARLGVRKVPSRGGVLIGFHEKRSSYIADLSGCSVLPPHVSAMLPQLRVLVEELSIADRIPQIELVMGERESGEPVTVLIFRHLLPFSDADLDRLRAFGELQGVDVWLQPGSPDTAHPLTGGMCELFYSLPEFDVRLAFCPGDFTQVNVHTNRLLVRRAMQLLDPNEGERIGDLFCGLGNFTLPIARRGATVTGVEGSEAMVARATKNARANGLDDLAIFYAADLFETTGDSFAALGSFDKLLLDPPREGAIAVVKAIEAGCGPGRIVYVSCNPATLARDAAVLVREKGYVLRGAGIANMFPHTSHVESVALFERG